MISTSSLRERIRLLVASNDFAPLGHYLQSLRATDHRNASLILAEEKTWSALSQTQWWEAFALLCTLSAKAYLGTLLKAAQARSRREALHFESQALRAFCHERATDIDRRKMLDSLLPLASSPRHLRQLCLLLRVEEESEAQQALHYLKAETSVAYYELFCVLRRLDDKPPLIRRFAIELIRKNEKKAFNLASILASYFDLAPLPGTFSLQLEPHQLSRLESDYEAFSAYLLQ